MAAVSLLRCLAGGVTTPPHRVAVVGVDVVPFDLLIVVIVITMVVVVVIMIVIIMGELAVVVRRIGRGWWWWMPWDADMVVGVAVRPRRRRQRDRTDRCQHPAGLSRTEAAATTTTTSTTISTTDTPEEEGGSGEFDHRVHGAHATTPSTCLSDGALWVLDENGRERGMIRTLGSELRSLAMRAGGRYFFTLCMRRRGL